MFTQNSGAAEKMSLGKRGEEVVAQYLAQHGFEILARNIHTRWGEVDILALRAGRLHVVEVKTRASSVYGDAATALTPQKFIKIKKCMADLLQHSAGFNGPWQIDFAVVEVRSGAAGTARLQIFWNVGMDDLG